MTDREALTAALEDADYRLEQGNSISPPYVDRTLLALAAAARKTLPQLPEKCGNCNGTGSTFDDPNCYACTCPTCHGSGRVYPAELVERVTEVLYHGGNRPFDQVAVAVLDALNGTADG